MKIKHCRQSGNRDPLNYNIEDEVFLITPYRSHCMKSVQIRSYFWSYFPIFGLNTERYEVSLCIQSECRKIRTRKHSVFGHFSRSEICRELLKRLHLKWCNSKDLYYTDKNVMRHRQ